MKFEKIKYINHKGNQMVWGGGENGIFVNSNTLHNYKWNTESNNNKITSFSRGITEFNLPIVIACKTEDEGNAVKNKLIALFDIDVNEGQAGTLWIGDYYIKCYVSANVKSKYNVSDRFMTATLTITTDEPFWIKESRYVLYKHEHADDFLDFPYDFPYDYKFETTKNITNKTYLSCDFKMEIYGEVTAPCVTIEGHQYAVNCTVNRGETLVIDSVSKKIYRIVNGYQINEFGNRYRDEYIFEKIPSGTVSVDNNGLFNCVLTIYEKRSEPLWI